MAIEYAKGYAKDEMVAVVICEKFGWTYEQYLNQPQFFIDLIIQKLKVDAQKEENEIKKIK